MADEVDDEVPADDGPPTVPATETTVPSTGARRVVRSRAVWAWSTWAWAEAICASAEAMAPVLAPCAFTAVEAVVLATEAFAAVRLPRAV